MTAYEREGNPENMDCNETYITERNRAVTERVQRICSFRLRWADVCSSVFECVGL